MGRFKAVLYITSLCFCFLSVALSRDGNDGSDIIDLIQRFLDARRLYGSNNIEDSGTDLNDEDEIDVVEREISALLLERMAEEGDIEGVVELLKRLKGIDQRFLNIDTGARPTSTTSTVPTLASTAPETPPPPATTTPPPATATPAPYRFRWSSWRRSWWRR